MSSPNSSDLSSVVCFFAVQIFTENRNTKSVFGVFVLFFLCDIFVRLLSSYIRVCEHCARVVKHRQAIIYVCADLFRLICGDTPYKPSQKKTFAHFYFIAREFTKQPPDRTYPPDILLNGAAVCLIAINHTSVTWRRQTSNIDSVNPFAKINIYIWIYLSAIEM